MEKRKDKKGRVLKEGESQRPNGGYAYRWRTKTGKRLSVYAKTLPELREKEKQISKDTLNGLNLDERSMTLNELFEKWKSLKISVKPNTISNYCYMYERYAKDDFGKIKVRDIKRSDVRCFYNKLVDKKGLKVATVDNLHSCIHQVLNVAVEDDYIPYNPSDNALKDLKKSGKGKSKKRTALTVQQEETLFEFLRNSKKFNRWYAVQVFMYETGLRVGEMAALQREDLDLMNGFVMINKTLVHYKDLNTGKIVYEIHSAKTATSRRVIPLTERAKQAIMFEYAYQIETGITCIQEISGYNNFVFLNRYGIPFKDCTVNRALVRIVEECNKELGYEALPRISNHISRHTLSTRLNEANINVKVIQGILGHATADITMNVYTDATPDFLKNSLKEYNEKRNEKLTPVLIPNDEND